jgi:hypothetical protein
MRNMAGAEVQRRSAQSMASQRELRRRLVALILRNHVAALSLALAACPPARAIVFTDVTTSAGINHIHMPPELILELPGEPFFAGGAAAGDFDGDGRVDLVFTRPNDTEILYRNLGDGTFEPRTSAAGFRFPTYTNGVTSGDVDNDGDLDLYMTTVGYTRNYLYLNDGHGKFTDAGAGHTAALSNGTIRDGSGASFGDYDNDGYLDLVTGDWGNFAANSQSRLLRNRGAAQPGAFDDVTVAAGINVYRKDRSYRYSPRLVDLDRDGLLDLTFAADFQTSQLFWNNGDGTFTDGTIAAGVGTDLNGMGTTFGDYDSDGDLDWFITNITNDPEHPGPFGGWNRLYRNEGNRTFTDVTQAAGVRDSRFSWGASFFDYDNDGDVDLAATNGYNGQGWIDDRTFLWRNDAGVYTDVSDASGITDTLQGRGLIHLDYDDDGDLDMVVVNNAAAPLLYRNDGGNDNHFLRVAPQGTISNRDGIGAWITVTPDLTDPGRQLVWEVDGGSSFVSQSERTAHFGLGASGDSVDLVTIEWPSGIVQHLFNVDADQTLVVVETPPLASADFDGDLDVDWGDLALWTSGFGTISAARSQGDADGDSVADGEDFLLWQRQLGIPAAASESLAIPEPNAGALLVVAGLVCTLCAHFRYVQRP